MTKVVELDHEKTSINSVHRKFSPKPNGRRLFRHDAGDRFEVESAGTRPGNVRPEAIAVMKELGIDISGHRSKHVQEFENQSFDYVLTVCDNAKESCPVFPAHSNRIHKVFEDPAALQGTEEERLSLFRRIRDEIQDYLRVFPS